MCSMIESNYHCAYSLMESALKTSSIAAFIAFTVAFAADVDAELYKCVKDGKTTYQEQPCGDRGAAEMRMQASKPSGWVGCYRSIAPAIGTGAVSNKETIEVRQEGSTLYSYLGMEGRHETRLIWAPASPRQMGLMRDAMAGKERDGIDITSGLVVSGTALGAEVKNLPEEQVLMALWWIRGLEIEGDPMGHLPRTKETLRTSKETLYLFAALGAFDKVSKVPCAKGNR